MPIFSTNSVADVYRSQGLSMFGQAELTCVMRAVKIAVLDLKDTSIITPSKIEQSGTHGRADVDKGIARVQFPPLTRLNNEDVVVIDQAAYRVSSTQIIRDLFLVESFVDVEMRRMDSMPPIIGSTVISAAGLNTIAPGKTR